MTYAGLKRVCEDYIESRPDDELEYITNAFSLGLSEEEALKATVVEWEDKVGLIKDSYGDATRIHSIYVTLQK